MLLWGILCVLLGCAILAATLLLPARQRHALPLYVQVEPDAENVEWLLIELLRKAPQHQLLIIDNSSGENSSILRALSRQYHLSMVKEAPPGAPLLYARRGVTACGLLAQYKRSQQGATQRARG